MRTLVVEGGGDGPVGEAETGAGGGIVPVETCLVGGPDGHATHPSHCAVVTSRLSQDLLHGLLLLLLLLDNLLSRQGVDAQERHCTVEVNLPLARTRLLCVVDVDNR